MTIQEAIAGLDRVVPRAGDDLPEDLFLFVSRVTPLVNVDLLIKDGQNRTLLTWRDDQFYGSGWHVPGGIVRYKERTEDRIRKVAQEEIGSPVEFDPAPAAVLESFSDQRHRGHFISLLYRCRLCGEPDPVRRADGLPQRGQWKWHCDCPDDLLPVQQMYARFLG